jgi:hypothetical protein
MHRTYPSELRMRVIGFVEGGDPDVKRVTNSRSASVLRSGGCNVFAKTALPNLCAVEGALRHWRSIRGRSSYLSARSRTSRRTRSFAHCRSGESVVAAARVPIPRSPWRHARVAIRAVPVARRKRQNLHGKNRHWTILSTLQRGDGARSAAVRAPRGEKPLRQRQASSIRAL